MFNVLIGGSCRIGRRVDGQLVLPAFGWLLKGSQITQFDHDLIDITYDLTGLFGTFACVVSLWRGLWLR